MSDLDRLREIGHLVRQPAFDDLLDTRHRRTWRARIATASTLAVAAAATVVVLAATGHSVRTEPPPIAPAPSTPTQSPTPTQRLEVPAGQHTLEPDISPGDVRGFDEVVTVTNTQPEHRNDTLLSATVTVPTDSSYVVYACRSHDVPTWIAYADGDLVSDSPGAAHDWWTFRRCPPDDSMSLALHADLTEPALRLGLEQKTVRMLAIAPPSAELRDCLASDDSAGYCPLPDPIAATDAEFGFRIYEHRSAPLVLKLFKDVGNGEPWQFEALSIIKGVDWLLDRAVVAAPDAHRLAFELPASDAEHLVDVYVAIGPHRDRCMAQHADRIPDWETTDHNVYEAAVDRVCGVGLRLVVDGTTAAPQAVDPYATGHFRELGAHLSPEIDHQVEVEVVRGDPRNIRYAVVVRTRT